MYRAKKTAERIIAVVSVCLFCLSLSACAAGEKEDAVAEEQTEQTEKASFSFSAIPEFTTRDMAGDEVTNEIFAQADLTVVNFWGTFCGPCIDEMPELAGWSAELPDNVQLIGIMVDVVSEDTREYALAEEIIAETGAAYENLLMTEELNEFFQELAGIPATFFVDKEGNFIAVPILGADVERYKKTVKDICDRQVSFF